MTRYALFFKCGLDIENEGSHDLQHFLNHNTRGGRMKDEEEVMYYFKRFQLYSYKNGIILKR